MSRTASAGAVSVLALVVGYVWVCIVGLVRSKGPFARLHFVGAVSLIAPPGIALAITLAGGAIPTAARAWLISAILFLTGGIVTHATARAEKLRREAEDQSGTSHPEEGAVRDHP